MARIVSPFAAAFAPAFSWPERVRLFIFPSGDNSVSVSLSITKRFMEDQYINLVKKSNKLPRTQSNMIAHEPRKLQVPLRSYHNAMVIKSPKRKAGRIGIRPVKQVCCPRGKITLDII